MGQAQSTKSVLSVNPLLAGSQEDGEDPPGMGAVGGLQGIGKCK